MTPEVRQCLDDHDPQYGAVAVEAGDDRWGVMSPVNGGHWATDEEVKDWERLGSQTGGAQHEQPDTVGAADSGAGG